MGWTLAVFVVLSLAALAVALAPGWWAVPVAGLAGAANAGLWRQLVRSAVAGRRPRALLLRLPRIAPLVVPLAVAMTVGPVTAMSGFAGFGTGQGLGVAAPMRSPARNGRPAVVLYVDGYDSSYDGSSPITVSPGLVYARYSYSGLTSRSLPRPYGALTTHQPIGRSARLLAARSRNCMPAPANPSPWWR